LNFSTSIFAALLELIPSMATRPERIVGIPILIGLFCARETKGAASEEAPITDAESFKSFRLVDRALVAAWGFNEALRLAVDVGKSASP
jgi:hypothetical protein